jgi:hypothetical protein
MTIEDHKLHYRLRPLKLQLTIPFAPLRPATGASAAGYALYNALMTAWSGCDLTGTGVSLTFP